MDRHLRNYFLVFGALLALTGVTVGAAFIDMGPANTLVALGIAAFKATLVVLIFMHVKEASRMTQIFAGAGLLWVAILIAITLGDYWTRTPVEAGMAPQPESIAVRPVVESGDRLPVEHAPAREEHDSSH